MVKTLPLPAALDQLELPELQRNLFSSPDWMEVIYKTYGLQLYIKFIEHEGTIRSYIIYSIVKNFLEWKICLCSYCDYCDGYVQSMDDWNQLFQSLRDDFPEYRIAVRNLRDRFARDVDQLRVLSTEHFHYLDVRDDLQVVWKRAHDSFKAAVNQGRKKGVVVKQGKRIDLNRFYDSHLKVRKNKYKIFPQPFKFFDVIWRQYMEQNKGILLAAYGPDGQFIAGNIYLICGNTLYYKFNTSLYEGLKYRPNNLLFWEGVKLAKERSLDYVDLGSSGLEQQGLVLFKNHTGAKQLTITHLGFEPAGYKFSQKRILKTMTNFFTQPWVPDFMVKWGSHIIYPYLA